MHHPSHLESWRDPLGVTSPQEHGGVDGPRCQLDLLSQQRLTAFISTLAIMEFSGNSSNVAQFIKDTYRMSLLE